MYAQFASHQLASPIRDTKPYLSIGTDVLDEVLGAGFFINRFFLVNGEPGAGKATLALRFLIEGVGAGQQSAVRHYP